VTRLCLITNDTGTRKPGKAMLERVMSMLTKLVARFESDARTRRRNRLDRELVLGRPRPSSSIVCLTSRTKYDDEEEPTVLRHPGLRASPKGPALESTMR
jgi:hypothetical protein